MLTLNADDVGRSRAETDSALACLRSGSITSVTGMVYMEDSARAAESVRGGPWDVGLHLNLSEPFTSKDAPAALRERQARLARFLRSNRYALVLFHPLLVRDFDYVVKAQIDAFAHAYGRTVERLDGHQHMHLATNVLVQKLLPEGIRVRRSFTFEAGERGSVNLWYRRRVDRSLRRRHRLCDRFYSLSQLLDPAHLAAVCSAAQTLDIEVMTHPIRPAEYQLLASETFAGLVSQAGVSPAAAVGRGAAS
jgi:chitin disaccharide deacetylase